MWNVRNILRQIGGRLKTSVNSGAQSGKEGRSELEDEYKLWTSNLWANDLFTSKSTHNVSEKAGLLFASTKKNEKKSGQDSSDSERHEWHAADVQSNHSWLEALGWGAALGLGLNILQLRQEEHLRKRSVEQDGCRFSPRWFTNVALSMPHVTGQPGLIRSVLPFTGARSLDVTDSRDSYSLEYDTTSYGSDVSNSPSCSEFPEYPKPSYTSETAVMMALLRQQLTEVASDYVGALQNLLAPRAPINRDHAIDATRFRRAQEEYNLGLYHELGINVRADSDQAFKHYVEAALLDHPGAIQNILSFHKYASAFPDSEVDGAPPPFLHRCSSSPTLSTCSSVDSGRDSVASIDFDEGDGGKSHPAKRKFWTSSDEDSHSSSGMSRSSSFPVLPCAISCT